MKRLLTMTLCVGLLCGCSTPARIASTVAAAAGGAAIGNKLGGTTGALIGGAGGALISETAHAVGNSKLKSTDHQGFLEGRAQAYRSLAEDMRRAQWPSPPQRFDARDYSDYPQQADYVNQAQMIP